jgi:hypothetical protein
VYAHLALVRQMQGRREDVRLPGFRPKR